MRAFVVAVSTVFLALAAHLLGGGDVPHAIVLVPLAAVALAAAVPLSARRVGLPGAVAMLGVGQLVLHHAFDALSGMGCAPAAGSASVQHVHAAAQTMQVACTSTHAGSAPALGGSAMLVVHVVATLLTAALIAGTDRALTWITTWMRPLVALLAPVALPASATLPVKVEAHVPAARRDVAVVPLRGPPLRAAHVTLAA